MTRPEKRIDSDDRLASASPEPDIGRVTMPNDAGPPATSREDLLKLQMGALRDARRAAVPILRAAHLARLNGAFLWFGAAMLALSAIWSPTAGLFALGVGVAAFRERRGARGLLALDDRAPRRLAGNQLLMIGCALGYCAWQLFASGSAAPTLTQQLSEAGLRESDLAAAGIHPEDFDSLERTIKLMVYGSVAAGATVFHGGLAIYYLTRCRRLRELLAGDRETVSFALEWQRAA